MAKPLNKDAILNRLIPLEKEWKQKKIAIALLIILPIIITLWANIPGLLPHTKKFINGATGPAYIFSGFLWYYADTMGRGKAPTIGWIFGFAFVFPVTFLVYLIMTRNAKEAVKLVFNSLVLFIVSILFAGITENLMTT